MTEGENDMGYRTGAQVGLAPARTSPAGRRAAFPLRLPGGGMREAAGPRCAEAFRRTGG